MELDIIISTGIAAYFGLEKERSPKEGESEVVRREVPCSRLIVFVVVDVGGFFHLRSKDKHLIEREVIIKGMLHQLEPMVQQHENSKGTYGRN